MGSGSRDRARWAIATAALLLLLVVLFSLRSRKVPAARAERRAIVETLVVNGRVLARSRAEVGAQIAGTVAEVRVREADRVRKGDLLVALAGTEELAEVQRARMALEEAQARLATLTTTTHRRNQESLEQAKLRQAEAEREVERLAALAKAGLVPAADLESARRRAGIARSEVQSMEAALRGTSSGGGESAEALANVATARAALASANARLAQTRITAPADGTVLTREVEPGAVVGPGQTVLVMTLDSATQLLAQPDEKSLGSLAIGQRARVSADAFPDRHFDAFIERIAPNVDLQRGTVDVWLRVPGPPPYLKTDMTLSVEIESGRKASAIVIPADAVRDAAQPWVMVIEDGRAAKRSLTLGLRGDENVEVTKGLTEGEYVLRGAAAVGDRVRPVVPGDS